VACQDYGIEISGPRHTNEVTPRRGYPVSVLERGRAGRAGATLREVR